MNDKAYQPTVDNTTTPPKGYSKCTNRILDNLNELRDAVYQDAVKHGLWKDNPSPEHFLMQTMVEISEAIQANGTNKRANINRFNYITYSRESCGNSLFESYIKDTVEDELADVVLMLLSFSGYMKFDLSYDACTVVYSKDIYAPLKYKTFEEFCFNLCNYIIQGYGLYAIYMVMAYCEHNNIDLTWHIEQKMKYNSTREYLHGKKN